MRSRCCLTTEGVGRAMRKMTPMPSNLDEGRSISRSPPEWRSNAFGRGRWHCSRLSEIRWSVGSLHNIIGYRQDCCRKEIGFCAFESVWLFQKNYYFMVNILEPAEQRFINTKSSRILIDNSKPIRWRVWFQKRKCKIAFNSFFAQLNFSEWNPYHSLEQMIRVISGEMPMDIQTGFLNHSGMATVEKLEKGE